MIVIVGGDSWMIDVPVVQYFGLTGVGVGSMCLKC